MDKMMISHKTGFPGWVFDEINQGERKRGKRKYGKL